MKNKSIKLILLSISLLIVLLVVVSISYLSKNDKQIEEKKNSCEYVDNNRYGSFVDLTSFVDCFGILSVETNDSAYTIRDDKHDYNIAIVGSKKDYLLQNDFLYIYDDYFKKIAKPDSKEPVNYGMEYFVNGEVKLFTYPHIPDIPKYIKVEINTGEVTLYKTYDQMPKDAKQIYEELEKN